MSIYTLIDGTRLVLEVPIGRFRRRYRSSVEGDTIILAVPGRIILTKDQAR